MIQASITSDNGVFNLTTDATAYFRSLTPAEVVLLMNDNFGGLAGDRLAFWLEDKHSTVQAMLEMNKHLDALHVGEQHGFEVNISAPDTLAWLKSERADQPDWADVTGQIEVHVKQALAGPGSGAHTHQEGPPAKPEHDGAHLIHQALLSAYSAYGPYRMIATRERTDYICATCQQGCHFPGGEYLLENGIRHRIDCTVPKLERALVSLGYTCPAVHPETLRSPR